MAKPFIQKTYFVAGALLFCALVLGGCQKSEVVDSASNAVDNVVENSPPPTSSTPAPTPRPKPDDVLRLSESDTLAAWRIVLNDVSLDQGDKVPKPHKSALIVYKDASGMAMAEYVTLIPLRAVGEGLKHHVVWTSSTRSVYINGQKAPVPLIWWNRRLYLEEYRAEVFFNGRVDIERFGKDKAPITDDIGLVRITVKEVSTR